MAKFREDAVVFSQKRIATGIYSMWIKTDKIAKEASAGQFINIYCKDGSRILPRPISICEIDKANKMLRIVYRVVGAGTCEFALYNDNDIITIMGPLGNGFPQKSATSLLIGGGIGIPPMVQLAKELGEGMSDNDKSKQIQIVCGYRNELFLNGELLNAGSLYIATEDGSVGIKGTVIDAIKANDIKAGVIYACGPMPMLRAVKEYAAEKGVEAWLSLEERMACGIGACLGCVCKTKEKDFYTHVNNTRVCANGPVFSAEEVEI